MTGEVHTTTVPTPDGRALCVEVAGEDSGRPVLVQGGTPNSRHLYERWIEDAERRGIRLFSYDRPGYGGSTPQPGHSVADGAADVRAIAEAFEVDRLAVWGISGGGPYALASASLDPDLIVAAGAVGSIAPWDAPALDYFGGMGEENVEDVKLLFSDRDAARKKLGQDREDLMRVSADQITDGWKSLVSPPDAAVLNGGFAQWLLHGFQDGLAPGDQGWWDDGIAHVSPWGFELDSIRVPVKVWHGRHDRFVPLQHGRWLAEHVPNAEAELSENDGHLTLIVSRIPEVHEWLLRHF